MELYSASAGAVITIASAARMSTAKPRFQDFIAYRLSAHRTALEPRG